MTPRRFAVTETREVMEVTAGNLDEVAAWCGGEVLDSGDVMFDTGREGRDTDFAYPGDVLVHNGPWWYTVPVESFDRHSAGWTEETT